MKTKRIIVRLLLVLFVSVSTISCSKENNSSHSPNNPDYPNSPTQSDNILVGTTWKGSTSSILYKSNTYLEFISNSSVVATFVKANGKTESYSGSYKLNDHFIVFNGGLHINSGSFSSASFTNSIMTIQGSAYGDNKEFTFYKQ